MLFLPRVGSIRGVSVRTRLIQFMDPSISVLSRDARGSTLLGWAFVGCVAAALIAVVVLGFLGAQREIELARRTYLQAELAVLRSHALRTVGAIENHFEENSPLEETLVLIRAQWLRAYWQGIVSSRANRRLYAAILSPEGRVLAHSDASKEGQSIERNWSTPVPESEEAAATLTSSEVLASGQRAYDVAVPIQVLNKIVAVYHVGMSADWFDDRCEGVIRPVLIGWIAAIGGVVVVVVALVASSSLILRRQAALRWKLTKEQALRIAERNQLVVGLAHEIRNPLNAIRINLHVLEKYVGASSGAEDDAQTIVSESAREVERIESLMADLTGLATSDAVEQPMGDLAMETKLMADFLRESLTLQGIRLEVKLPAAPLSATIGRSAFRQVLLNLVQNARDALSAGGTILVNVERHADRAIVTIADDGPGVPEERRARLFEPFYTTRPGGIGLGLTIARKLVEEAGGEITYAPVSPKGASFQIVLPFRSVEGRVA